MKKDLTTGVIYRISNVISNYFLVNILWVIFSLPVMYIFLIITTVKNFQEFVTLLSILAVLLPFIFFPATTAMYAVVRRWVMKEADTPLWQSFLGYYKESYLKSMVGGIILTVIWTVFLVDFYYLVVILNKQFIVLFVPLFIIIFVFTLNFFSSLVHFEERILILLKNAILFTLGNPFLTLGTAGLCLVIIYFSFKFTFLLFFYLGSLIAFVSYKGFNQIYLKIKSSREN